jgi:hypothetical protein
MVAVVGRSGLGADVGEVLVQRLGYRCIMSASSLGNRPNKLNVVAMQHSCCPEPYLSPRSRPLSWYAESAERGAGRSE